MPARRSAARSVSGAPVTFAVVEAARHSDLQLTGPRLDVHASLRPVHSLTPPSGALSVGFTVGISHAGATQAMRLRSITASGLSPYGSTGTSRHHSTTFAGRSNCRRAGSFGGFGVSGVTLYGEELASGFGLPPRDDVADQRSHARVELRRDVAEQRQWVVVRGVVQRSRSKAGLMNITLPNHHRPVRRNARPVV